MISWMQKHRKYLVVTIWISTIAFVGAGFVGWGAYSYNQQRSNAAATVGDTKITVKELQTAYNNTYNYYNRMLGGQLTKEKAEALHLQDIALNQLIQEALLLNYAREHGIIALKDEVLAKIRAIEAFQANGVFDKKRYFQVLRSIGTDSKTFEDGIRKEVVIEKLNRLLGLPAAPVEAKMLFAATALEDKVAVKSVTIDPDAIKIDEAELRKFWEAHKSEYLSKKRYELGVIRVDAKLFEIPEADLRAYYDAHKTRFKDKEDKILPFEKAKDAVRLTLQKKKAKTEALKKYLALKHGKISPEENLTVSEGNTTIPLEKIRTAAKGSYIKTIALPEGFMTAQLIAVHEPAPLSFEEAAAMARQQLKAQKMQQLLAEKAKAAQKEPKGFKEIGYISRSDLKRIDFLSPAEAKQFLDRLFASKTKEGYQLFRDKAVVYRIEDQKLFDAEKFAARKQELLQSAEGLKQSIMQQSLIQQLQKRYKIEKHIKG